MRVRLRALLLGAGLGLGSLSAMAQQSAGTQETINIAVSTAGTANPYAPLATGPFVCDPIRFVGTSSLSSSLVWDFGNPESGNNSGATPSGQAILHQYAGLTTSQTITAFRSVSASNASDSSSVGVAGISLRVPSQRYAIRNTAFLYATSASPTPVAGDQFVDASDGTIESHYGRWVIDAIPFVVVPGNAVTIGGCGGHTLTSEAHYTSYDPNAPSPSPVGQYLLSFNTSYVVRPFTVAIGAPSSGPSTITFPSALRVASDGTSFVGSPSATACSYQWSFQDNSGSTILAGPSGTSTLGSLPSFTLSKSFVQPGDRVVLSVTVSTSSLSGPCQSYSAQTSSLGITAPAITPASALSRTAGSTGSVSTVAFVSDAEDTSSALVVTATSVPSGITLSNITNSNGTVAATIAATCSASLGSNVVTLRVSDSTGLSSSANFTINVSANTPPTLGNYPGITAGSTDSADSIPSAPPSDNGTPTVSAQATTGNPGALSVNSTTGVVTVTNANDGTYTIVVTATDNCGATSTKSFQLVVSFPAPGGFVATATSQTAVQLSWNAVAAASYYQITRKASVANNVTDVFLNPISSPFVDGSVAPNTSYLYKIQAVRFVNGVATPSPESNPDLATTVIFTDDPISARSTRIKGEHILELRSAVDAVRRLANKNPVTYTDSTLSGQLIKAVHLAELRSDLMEARLALLPPLTFSSLPATGATINAIDLNELRDAVK